MVRWRYVFLEKYSNSIIAQALELTEIKTIIQSVWDLQVHDFPKVMNNLPLNQQMQILENIKNPISITKEENEKAQIRILEIAEILTKPEGNKEKIQTWLSSIPKSLHEKSISNQEARLESLLKKSILYPENYITISEIVLILGEIGRKSGLLAIESFVERIQDEFLRTGLEMVVNGTDPIIIEKIYNNYIIQRKNKFKLQLRAMAQAISGIQAGDNPKILSSILQSAV